MPVHSSVADLGFLKGRFCSAEEWQKKKKVSNFYTLFFLSPNPCFPFFLRQYENYYTTTVIEYLDVTVLLDSLNLTALLEYLILKLST